jgi:hypothetical protein
MEKTPVRNMDILAVCGVSSAGTLALVMFVSIVFAVRGGLRFH